jgi:FkbM family methyltransferase
MFIEVDGTISGIDRARWTWPRTNTRMLRYFTSDPSDVNAAIELLPFVRGSCVQAGGCMGIWPLRLAQIYSTVYTFEPQPESFHCLQANILGVGNIRAFHAALGDERGFVGMTHREDDNYGAAYVEPGATIEMQRIDDLGLDDCGLIYLDVEGYESKVIRGAVETIERCKPAIGVEVKFDAGVVPLLLSMGYRIHRRTNLDVILRAD